MTNPYITQMVAQAKIDQWMLAAAARNGGVRRRRAASSGRGRIRAWWDAQVHPGRRNAPARPAVSMGEVATCSR